MRDVRGRRVTVLFGCDASRCEPENTRGDDERSIRPRECLTERLDGAAIRLGSALEVAGEREVVPEGEVDHSIRLGSRTPQAIQIIKRATVHRRPGSGEGGGRRVRAG